MINYLGDIINDARNKLDLTQDQYGSRYEVSGPAVFKIERGHVRPSLRNWLKMAQDAGIPERRAVLLWVKSRLPEKYQDYIELQSAAAAGREVSKKRGKKPDYSKLETRDQIRQLIEKDMSLPKGLRDLLKDDELWSLYKPTGHEINVLRDIFGSLGRGNKSRFREALHLIREFAHSF